MIAAVRWVVTLFGDQQDVQRLAETFSEISEVEGEIYDVQLTLDDPEGDVAEGDASGVGRAVIEAHVRRINGFGRLRWGRIYKGVEITGYKTIDADGETVTIHFLESASDYLLPDEWVAMADQRGIPRARLPAGMEALSDLDGEVVTALAATDPGVALVLRLVDEMLAGEEQIDWGAAYSALEVIEHDLHDRGLKGEGLGWWTAKERDDFRATANSVEVLGEHARHGKPFGLTEPRMDTGTAMWFVRRVAALWVTWLLTQHDASAD
jgi:hypothetical protein